MVLALARTQIEPEAGAGFVVARALCIGFDFLEQLVGGSVQLLIGVEWRQRQVEATYTASVARALLSSVTDLRWQSGIVVHGLLSPSCRGLKGSATRAEAERRKGEIRAAVELDLTPINRSNPNPRASRQ
jgi:hypothetical protein